VPLRYLLLQGCYADALATAGVTDVAGHTTSTPRALYCPTACQRSCVAVGWRCPKARLSRASENPAERVSTPAGLHVPRRGGEELPQHSRACVAQRWVCLGPPRDPTPPLCVPQSYCVAHGCTHAQTAAGRPLQVGILSERSSKFGILLTGGLHGGAPTPSAALRITHHTPGWTPTALAHAHEPVRGSAKSPCNAASSTPRVSW
jgi:hypothetical protein